MPGTRQHDREVSTGRDAYARLLDEIRDGRLRPGDRLTETDIAARLGVSRTPVREAIRKLEADNLVSHVPHQGAMIRMLDYAEISELYEMRAVLEGTAARLAARVASEVELSELEAINAEMEAALGDGALLSRANRQFHAILTNAARNRFLVRSVAAVQTTLLILGPSTMQDSGRAAKAVAEHRAVLDAIRQRDGATAETLMRRHIAGAHRSRLRQLRQEAAA